MSYSRKYTSDQECTFAYPSWKLVRTVCACGHVELAKRCANGRHSVGQACRRTRSSSSAQRKIVDLVCEFSEAVSHSFEAFRSVDARSDILPNFRKEALNTIVANQAAQNS